MNKNQLWLPSARQKICFFPQHKFNLENMFFKKCSSLPWAINLFICTDIFSSLKPSHLSSIFYLSTNPYLFFYQRFLLPFPLSIPPPHQPIDYLYIMSLHPVPLFTFMATVSLTSTDLSCPFSSKKTSLWPALFRSPSASALMWRIFPLSSSTWE